MSLYKRIIAMTLATIILCFCVFGCSKKDADENEELNENTVPTVPRDSYIVSLYAMMRGEISFYDYDEQGRLLSVTAVDPYTMQPSNDSEMHSSQYTYDTRGNLLSMIYCSYEMELKPSPTGAPSIATYSDDEVSVEINFEYYDSGRIKKETVLIDGETYNVSEYGELGMLKSESMALVGDASYTYTQKHNVAVYTLTYGDKLVYTIENSAIPSTMRIDTANAVRYIGWRYDQNNVCTEYHDLTETSLTRYLNTYNAELELVDTDVYYASFVGSEYLLQETEYTYDDVGRITTESHISYNEDGSIWNKKFNEYFKGYCIKEIEESYDKGALSVKKETNTQYDIYSDNVDSSAYGKVRKIDIVEFNGSGEIQKRRSISIFYDYKYRLYGIRTKCYGVGDVYEGSEVEEYEYYEDGSYKVTYSETDANGEIINKTEEIVEPD